MDKDLRANATQLLSEAMGSAKSIPSAHLEPLSNFFCDRIQDHHSIVPNVLHAMAYLVCSTNLVAVFDFIIEMPKLRYTVHSSGYTIPFLWVALICGLKSMFIFY